MSDLPPPAGGPGSGEPSEEEVRAYLGQMRGAPVDQIIAEVVQGLLNAAQVKLGRRDGRLLIDLVGTINDQVRPFADGQLVGQIDEALTQLRLAQVEAEREVAQATSEGHTEPNDLSSAPPGQPQEQGSGQAPSTGQAPPPQQDPSSPLNKLWIPGT